MVASVERAHIEIPSLNGRAIVERLAALSAATGGGGVLAFDADGTLWSGDVGEDVFELAMNGALLREDAADALRREAAAFGFATRGNANELAERLFEGYLAGAYPEREVCAMMSWCYAGFTRTVLIELARRAFAEKDLADRLHRELEPVFEFARDSGLRVVVVSASPDPVVRAAVELWSIGAEHVTASRAAEEGDRILPRLAAPVPYAEAKPVALRALVGEATLIGSFGDNVFDIDLLQAAQLGVAIRPKTALRMRLPELEGLVLLER
jgi:phosphatidylglycerophosphatase C